MKSLNKQEKNTKIVTSLKRNSSSGDTNEQKFKKQKKKKKDTSLDSEELNM